MALIGEKGYVAVSNIERTLGLTPPSSMVRIVCLLVMMRKVVVIAP